MTVNIKAAHKGIEFDLDSTPEALRSDLHNVREAIEHFLNEETGAVGSSQDAAAVGDASKWPESGRTIDRKAAAGKAKKEEPEPKQDDAPATEPAKDDTPQEPEAEEPAKDEPAQDETPDAPRITQEQLRQQVMAYAAEHGNTKGKYLVEKFCAEGESAKISNIPKDQYLNAYLAAGGAV